MWELLLRHGYEPIREILSQSGFRSQRKSLEENQWRPPAEIARQQLQAARDIVRIAYEQTPYYREVFGKIDFHPEDLHQLSDLQQLPILSKSKLKEHYQTLRNPHQSGLLHTKRTSGSTGRPLEIFLDDSAMTTKHAITRRANEWSGWRYGQPIAKLWGLPEHRESGFKGRLRTIAVDRAIHLNTLEISSTSLRDFLRKWNHHAPALLFGHAHSLYLLASFARKNRLAVQPARGIISSAMPLHGFQRVVIEEVFQYRITDRYGCEETSLIACQCEKGGMHIAAESVLLEVIDGKILLTDLLNRAMPLIRYQIGDAVESAAKPCTCGRGLPTLGQLAGREADFILTADDRLLSGISLTENFILQLPGLEQIQIIQESRNLIRFQVVPLEASKRFDLQGSLIELAGNLFGSGIHFEVEFVESIASEPSGKFRFCVSKMAQDYLRNLAA
ncbi:phenylacetate--CoA ligase family protein [Telmatocola sphagniphila]|uniref:Phenylacetate--CoA ligase family protein n=1 Tax=Telmatocola sphagniphila TaxID=1123043 RepID=A0A8E6B990_9BACT|nr:phenylacetate--CoA ligase family protein [Telmatocola sphagniphila]QVL33639.1 phenylacetate--CoA ligase family protein [Telmatocola sphagniphila]